MSNQLLQQQQERAAFVDGLTKKKTAILGEADAIRNGAMRDPAGMRAMNKEELTAFNGHLAEVENINSTLEVETRAGNAFTDKGPSVHVHDNWTDNQYLFGRAPVAGETKRQRDRRIAMGLGEQLIAIKDAETQPAFNKVDKRLLELHQRAVAAGASEAVPADGGFLIQPDFSSEILEIAHDVGLIFTQARKLPMSATTNSLRIPGIDEQSRVDGSRWGGVRMYWENEADALTGSRPKFKLIELVTKKLTGLYYATNELLTDAAALGAIISQAFGEEMAFKMDDGCINGTGAGQLQGILTAPSLVTVAKESGQTAATFNWENVKKMYGRMWPRSRGRAAWFVNVDVEQQLLGLVQLVGTTGGVPVYLPAGGASASPYGTLLGRPVIPIEQCATVGTVGDAIFADMSQFIMVDKGDMQAAVSMHVRFVTDEMTYRWIYRTDGQPSWSTALTPFKGSNTLSPFVALATRS